MAGDEVLLTADTALGSSAQELLRPGWIEVSGPTITAIGAGVLTALPITTGGRDGGARLRRHSRARRCKGAGFSGGPDEIQAAVGLHRRHGTTSLVASLVTESPADLLRQVSALADDVHSGLISGIHLEGPGWP